MTTEILAASVRTAWSHMPAPRAEDLRFVEWGWGRDAWLALAGVAPVDVDVSSAGFLACTPLLDLPPEAAAAYLGTYLLSLLDGLSSQEKCGLFPDLLTRAHVLACLADREFWRTVIRPFLPEECTRLLVEVSAHLASRRDLLALSEGETDRIAAFATDFL